MIKLDGLCMCLSLRVAIDKNTQSNCENVSAAIVTRVFVYISHVATSLEKPRTLSIDIRCYSICSIKIDLQ